jgi:hypothetical protein
MLIDVYGTILKLLSGAGVAGLLLARACAELHVHNPPDLVRALAGQTFSSASQVAVS